MQVPSISTRSSGSLRRRLVGRLLVVVAVPLAFGLVACSDDAADKAGDVADKVADETSDVGDKAADVADEVAETVDDLTGLDVEDALESSIGGIGIILDPDSLACIGTDDITEGASIECDFTHNGQPVGLVAEILGIDDTEIELDVRTVARPVPVDVLADAVATRASQQLGGTDTSATCTGDLEATVGATATCTVTTDDEEHDFEVVVDSVEGGRIEWGMQSA